MKWMSESLKAVLHTVKKCSDDGLSSREAAQMIVEFYGEDGIQMPETLEFVRVVACLCGLEFVDLNEMVKLCPYCESTKIEKVKVFDNEGKVDNHVVRCIDCGLSFKVMTYRTDDELDEEYERKEDRSERKKEDEGPPKGQIDIFGGTR